MKQWPTCFGAYMIHMYHMQSSEFTAEGDPSPHSQHVAVIEGFFVVVMNGVGVLMASSGRGQGCC